MQQLDLMISATTLSRFKGTQQFLHIDGQTISGGMEPPMMHSQSADFDCRYLIKKSDTDKTSQWRQAKLSAAPTWERGVSIPDSKGFQKRVTDTQKKFDALTVARLIRGLVWRHEAHPIPGAGYRCSKRYYPQPSMAILQSYRQSSLGSQVHSVGRSLK